MSILNWKIIKVPGDGTCGYHSIVKSMQLAKIETNRIIGNGFTKSYNLKNGKDLRIMCNEIFINIKFNIRNFIVLYKFDKLKEIIDKYRIIFNYKDIYKIEKTVKIIIIAGNNKIKKYKLINGNNKIIDNNYKKLKESNKNKYEKLYKSKLKEYIDDSLKLLDKDYINKINRDWIDEEIISFISCLLQINIIIFNNNSHKWIIYSKNPNFKKIFIYYNGYSHYDSLEYNGTNFEDEYKEILSKSLYYHNKKKLSVIPLEKPSTKPSENLFIKNNISDILTNIENKINKIKLLL